jgi:hypothetical protein
MSFFIFIIYLLFIYYLLKNLKQNFFLLNKKKIFLLLFSQTGSGKTYSMGTALDGSNIPLEHQGKI